MFLQLPVVSPEAIRQVILEGQSVFSVQVSLHWGAGVAVAVAVGVVVAQVQVVSLEQDGFLQYPL